MASDPLDPLDTLDTPADGGALPQAPPSLVLCPHCGRTLVVSGETVRLAEKADVVHLTDDERVALRRQRPASAKSRPSQR